MTGAETNNGVDRELVARSIGGDRDAYRLLVEKYQSRALGIALEIVKSREDAEDIVQESFVKAYLSLGEFRNQSAFYTWLYRIVYNMAIDFKRKVSRRGGEALAYEEGDEGGVLDHHGERFVSPHEAVVQKEQRARMERVLAQLTPEHRAVVVLREVEGLSYDEIARVVGVSKGTVMSRLHYARKNMQEALRDVAPEWVVGSFDEDSAGAGQAEGPEIVGNKVNESS